MQDTRLYTVTIPGQARTRADQTQQQRVQSNASLSAQGAGARALGSQPGERSLKLQYKGYNAELIARMVQELASNSSGYDVVPWIGVDDSGNRQQTDTDGWYAVSRAQRADQEPRAPNTPTVSLNLSKTGTRKKVWRKLSIERTVANVDGIVGSPTEDQVVGLPTEASTVRWFDGESSTQGATPTSTVYREFGQVDLYDLSSSPFGDDTAALLFDLSYDRVGPVDLKVWDTFNRSKTSTQNGQEVLEWQRVFDPSHEFETGILVDSGEIRMHLEEDSGRYWSETRSGGAWLKNSEVTNDWGVADVDLLYVGPSRVEAYVIFENSANGNTYPLWVSIRRGQTSPLWYRPADRAQQMAPVPSDLASFLGSEVDSTTWRLATQSGVISRSEVR